MGTDPDEKPLGVEAMSDTELADMRRRYSPDNWCGSPVVPRLLATIDRQAARIAELEGDNKGAQRTLNRLISELTGGENDECSEDDMVSALTAVRDVANELGCDPGEAADEYLKERRKLQADLAAARRELEEARKELESERRILVKQRNEAVAEAYAQRDAAQARMEVLREALTKAHAELSLAWRDWDADRDVKVGKRIGNAAEIISDAIALEKAREAEGKR